MKRISKFCIILLLLFLPATVFAGNEVARSDIYISADEQVDGNLFGAAETIIVDGDVDGDIIVAGGMVVVNGNVAGDVIAAGGQVKIFGPVQGDIRVAGGSVYLDSVVGKNATVFGGDIIFGNDAIIGSSLMVFAGNFDFRGSIGKDMNAVVGAARINGRVGEDVTLKVGDSDQFVLGSQSWIGGDLTYYSDSLAEVTSGATINGEVIQKSFKNKTVKRVKVFGLGLITAWAVFVGIQLIGMLLLGLFLLWAIPKHLEKARKALDSSFWPAFVWGLLAMALTPIVSLLLAFSLIGFPIAMFLMILYVLAGLYGMILISLYLGEKILKKVSKRHWRGVSSYWSMTVGVLVVIIMVNIPILGLLIKCFLVAAGMGGLIAFARIMIKQFR